MLPHYRSLQGPLGQAAGRAPVPLENALPPLQVGGGMQSNRAHHRRKDAVHAREWTSPPSSRPKRASSSGRRPRVAVMQSTESRRRHDLPHSLDSARPARCRRANSAPGSRCSRSGTCAQFEANAVRPGDVLHRELGNALQDELEHLDENGEIRYRGIMPRSLLDASLLRCYGTRKTANTGSRGAKQGFR